MDNLLSHVAWIVGFEAAKCLKEELLDGSEWSSESMVSHKQALDSVPNKRRVKKGGIEDNYRKEH